MMRANSNSIRCGATLLELIACVAILGMTASVTGLMIRRAPASDPADPSTVVADTLERVLGTGAPVTLRFVLNARSVEATVNPDGTVIADSALAIDRLTGRSAR
jgi:hypothetical protein